MFNWVSSGDPYTWTEDDWAHESEVTEPVYAPDHEEDEFSLPNLFDETGYRGSSDIDPEEPPPPQDEEDKHDLPNLDDMENLSLDETPPGPPINQSTPENTGARPKLKQTPEALNQFPGTNEFYPPFGPHDIYQARLQQIHRQYQEQFKETLREKERGTLRRQLYQNLEDAETSFKLLLKNPAMMTMNPEQLQALGKQTNTPKQEKKGLIKKLLTLSYFI
jgi:hypothetical protein